MNLLVFSLYLKLWAVTTVKIIVLFGVGFGQRKVPAGPWMEGDGQGGESPGPLPTKAQFPSPRPQLVLKSMLENVTFLSFFFSNNLYLQWLWVVPVIVPYWSLCICGGLEPEATTVSSHRAQVAGREVSDSRFSSCHLIPQPPWAQWKQVVGALCQLPELWLKTAPPALVRDRSWNGGHRLCLGAGVGGPLKSR